MLHEALLAIGATLSTQAFAYRNGDLLPTPLGVWRRGIAVGKAAARQLLLHPLAEGQDFRTQR